ncbi:MAG: magnesium transporter [Gemmatimonadota bacterium]|nr:MAG: magnesium transporter [Gemmatimonadota bacterium]
MLEQSQAADAAPFLAELPVYVAARVMSHMSLAAGAENLPLLGVHRAAPVAAELPVGSAASLLRRLDPPLQSDLLTALPEDLADQITRLLNYANGTVGAAVDPAVLAIPSDVTCETARRLLRSRGGLFHHQLYIVDRKRRLLGLVHVRDLVRAASTAPVSRVMQPATVRLQAAARIASTLSHPAWRDMDAIPVVDKTGVLLGILRHRQLRRLGEPPAESSLAGALLGLSELYWIGLSSLLPLVPTSGPNEHSAAIPKSGGGRGR